MCSTTITKSVFGNTWQECKNRSRCRQCPRIFSRNHKPIDQQRTRSFVRQVNGGSKKWLDLTATPHGVAVGLLNVGVNDYCSFFVTCTSYDERLGMTIGQHGIGDLDESGDIGTGKIIDMIALLAILDTAVVYRQHDVLQQLVKLSLIPGNT